MAAESDGVPDMVSGDDQPIDLSRTPRKPLRVMPPLIPIKLLRAGYTAQQANKQVKGHDITLASLIKGKSDLKLFQDARSKCGEDISKPAQPVASAGEGSDADDEKEGEEDDEEDGEVSRKRVRLANGGERVGVGAGLGVGVGEGEGGSGGERWQRLDRARSVPQLTPLPLPLQRSKSLSESRIPAAAGAAAAVAAAAAAAAAAGHLPRGDTPTLARPAAPATPLLGARSQSPPAELRLQLQAAAALRRAAEGAAAAAAAEGASAPATATAAAAAAAAGAAASASAAAPGATGAPFNNWIYVGYYSQLLHRFQAQEFLRQLALQHQQEQAAQKADPAAASKTAIPTQEEENADIRRKQARPLTGKHVRPGTGASPATLLTLRRKIQARQQQHDIKRILE